MKLLVLLQPNMGSVVVAKPHKTVALPLLSWQCCGVMCYSCCTHIYVCTVHIYVIITVLLTFDTHALQSYSSWLCLCVSFNFPWSNEFAKKTYGSPQHCKIFN